MTIDSGSEGLPENKRRIAERKVEADISPRLREHITEAAQRIRRDHHTELADVLKADGAVRLFRSIIHPNGFAEPSVVSGEGEASLAAEFGTLFGDAVRTGTGLLAGPLTALAQEWVATVIRPGAKPNRESSSAKGTVPGETSRQQPSVAPQMPGMAVDAAVSGAVPGSPAVSSEEVRLRGLFRQFMPMLVYSLSQGGTGHGLAEKVITLFGRPTYDQASGIGKERIMTIVKSDPDLWAQVAPIEARFSRFLDEFLGYDACVENPSTPGA
jgi:hypothetical protein